MWELLGLALSAAVFLPPGQGVDIPDVTTIYDVKDICEYPPTSASRAFKRRTASDYFVLDDELPYYETLENIQCNKSVKGRVYKRTNTLGLDLFLNDEKTAFENSEPGFVCDFGSSCDWEFTGWTSSQSEAEIGKTVKHGDMHSIPNGWTTKISRNIIKGNNIDKQGVLFVLTPGEGNIRDQSSIHVLKMFEGGIKRASYMYGCAAIYSTTAWNITDRDDKQMYLTCSSEYTNFVIDYSSTLRFSIKNIYDDYDDENTETRINIFVNGNEVVDRQISVSLDLVTVYYLSTPNFARLSVTSLVSVKTSAENGSSIVSPAFIPSSKNICLTLVLYCSADIQSKVLQISALDLYQTQSILYEISDLKKGWQVKQVNIDNIKTTSPIKLVIRKVNPVEVDIRRISSCSPLGLEVVKLPNHTVDQTGNVKNTVPIYTATSDMLPMLQGVEESLNPCMNGGAITISGGCACPPGFTGANCQTAMLQGADESLTSCMNGGAMTKSGCACLPGFTGANCQTGCGRNKFGQDCGGICSFRSRECEGFLLCSPFTGCQCAPGYQGYNCTTECSRGRYGNDCEQRCGHCGEGETCDIYSGECSSCRFGYVPPLCRQEYVYFSLPPTLASEKYKTITVSFNLQQGVKGVGEPKLYQIQFRRQGFFDWEIHTIKAVSKADSDETLSSINGGQDYLIKTTIDGLEPGTVYEVRVLLMDASFNKYDGELVKSARILTKCDIPEEFDYKIMSSSNTTAFTFTWNNELANEHWCPFEGYEVSWMENGEWITNVVNEPQYFLTDFRPGFTIDFRVRAKTSGGFAPYSKTIRISTLHDRSTSIQDLRMVSSQSTALGISWRPPIGSEELTLKYKVTFKCVTQVACAPGCKDALEGQLTQEGTSVTLSALLPFTQYLVTVTPENGPQSKLYVGTKEAVPTEAPVLSNQKPVRSNSSITVFWEPVSVCSSFLKGYTYQLTKDTESMKLLASGFTKDTSMSFYNLTASTDYVVKVFINTVAGWNPDVFLSINISTSATVPDAVQNLTVYKRGRTMLGLRWLEPKYLFGELKSFTVQHSLGKDVVSETVEPTHCVVWPEYYCHTLENLKSNRKYNIMVSARNMDMPEDGAFASLTTITKESAPLPPEDMKVLNRTSTSVSLQWKHPSLINGVLRSFLVNVEESEKFDQDSCCQDYPLVELQVKEEKEFYEVEVSGLHPASTYYMGVSAKTMSIGPSQSLSVNTRPPHLPVSVLPMWSLLADIEEFNHVKEEVEWLPQTNLPEVNKSDTFAPLIRAHIILATLKNSQGNTFSPLEAGIKNEQLLTLLDDSISGPFWFLTEYKEEELEADSEWGEKPAGVFIREEQYQLIAVQISDYNNVLNVDLQYSSPLIL